MRKPPKPSTARQKQAERDPPARREEVLETALTLVSEHGVAGASLRKLAAELGISQPSLYHYFASKDALVSGPFPLISVSLPADYFPAGDSLLRITKPQTTWVVEYTLRIKK